MQRGIAAVQRSIAPLQWSIAEVQRSVASMQWAIAVVQRSIASLQWRIAEVQQSIASLQWDVAVVQRGIASLQWRIAEVQRSIASLQWDVAVVQRGIAALQWRIAEVQREIASMQWAIAAVHRHIARVRRFSSPKQALERRLQRNDRSRHRDLGTVQCVSVGPRSLYVPHLSSTAGIQGRADLPIYIYENHVRRPPGRDAFGQASETPRSLPRVGEPCLTLGRSGAWLLPPGIHRVK
jgi:septal ring factor EnvC (AmiA/AmiB activator)